MCRAIIYSEARGADIDVRRHALQGVMAGFVEQVAEADYAASFEREISGQRRRAAAHDSRHGVQFLAAARQIRAGHEEICGCQSANGSEQDAILPIPERMVLWLLLCLAYRNRSYGCYEGSGTRAQGRGAWVGQNIARRLGQRSRIGWLNFRNRRRKQRDHLGVRRRGLYQQSDKCHPQDQQIFVRAPIWHDDLSSGPGSAIRTCTVAFDPRPGKGPKVPFPLITVVTLGTDVRSPGVSQTLRVGRFSMLARGSRD